MNLLLTLNIGGVLTENARLSHIEASVRWDCAYKEATLPYWPHPEYAHTYNKLPYLCDTQWDRILYFDADTLIREDAPPPHLLVPEDRIGFVSDIQPHQPKEMQDSVRQGVHEVFGEEIANVPRLMPGFTKPGGWLTDPFNGGVLIINPKVHGSKIQEITRRIPILPPHLKKHGHFEQALLNLWFSHMMYDHFCYLDYTWNRIYPPIDDPVMRDFVYHFTGVGFGDKRKAIETYNWRVS